MSSACQNTDNVAKQGRLCTTSFNASLIFFNGIKTCCSWTVRPELFQTLGVHTVRFLMHFGPTTKPCILSRLLNQLHDLHHIICKPPNTSWRVPLHGLLRLSHVMTVIFSITYEFASSAVHSGAACGIEGLFCVHHELSFVSSYYTVLEVLLSNMGCMLPCPMHSLMYSLQVKGP